MNYEEVAAQIQKQLDEANEKAIDAVKTAARQILRDNPDISSFVNGMGTSAFYWRKGAVLKNYYGYDEQFPDDPLDKEIVSEHDSVEDREWRRVKGLEDLMRFIQAFDGELKLTGQPMRLDSPEGAWRYDW